MTALLVVAILIAIVYAIYAAHTRNMGLLLAAMAHGPSTAQELDARAKRLFGRGVGAMRHIALCDLERLGLIDSWEAGPPFRQRRYYRLSAWCAQILERERRQ